MEVIPAIDLKNGVVVGLYQGDFHKETLYSDDPLGLASRYEAEGAPRLHIVDLDGARQGRPVNLGVINGISAMVDIPLQVGGGIREYEVARGLLNMGIDRMVIGTAAVESPELVERLCNEVGNERLVVAVDARDGKVAVKGWQEDTTISALDLAKRMAQLGVKRILYTDITRDGTLTRPSFAFIERLVKDTGLAVQAAGGVSSLKDIEMLATLGVEAVVVGSALLRGSFTLPQAQAVASQAVSQ